MIRYYGLYARHRKQDKQRFFMSFNRWRESIFISFGYDPLSCPDCGKQMAILEIYYNRERVSLQDLYERSMSKFKAAHWRSSA